MSTRIVLTKFHHSMLSRQLDHIPFLPNILCLDRLPRMHLAPNLDNDDAPKSYLERLTQARLAGFWRTYPPTINADYIETAAEERYEHFCTKFLATLPDALALEPSKQWDERLQRLPIQPQILHISIFETPCRNFRGLLLRETSQVQNLPAYKQVLFSSQKKALAVAALRVLGEISKLHAMLGGSHTRFPGIVLPTFEAAVVLMGVCEDIEFPAKHIDGPLRTNKFDPLGSGKPRVSRERCIQTAKVALARLRTLSEVSTMAEGGVNTLSRLLNNRNTSCSLSHVQRRSHLSAERAVSPPLSGDTTQPQQLSRESSSRPLSLEPPSNMELGPLSDFLFTYSADIPQSWEISMTD
jgi:hypothetical protein